MAGDSIIYLLKALGFLINLMKYVLQPCRTLAPLDVKGDHLRLPEVKKNKITAQC